MNTFLEIVEKQYKDLKFEYHMLIGGCLRTIEFNNYILCSSVEEFSATEKKEIEKLNSALNNFYEKLITFRNEIEKR